MAHINFKIICSSHGQFRSTLTLQIALGSMYSVQFSSVSQSCLTLCDPVDCSAPGFPVHHQLPELAQTHVHQVSDAIQPILASVVPFSSCLQSFPASESFLMSQLFASGDQSIGTSASASVLPMNIQVNSVYLYTLQPVLFPYCTCCHSDYTSISLFICLLPLCYLTTVSEGQSVCLSTLSIMIPAAGQVLNNYVLNE